MCAFATRPLFDRRSRGTSARCGETQSIPHRIEDVLLRLTEVLLGDGAISRSSVARPRPIASHSWASVLQLGREPYASSHASKTASDAVPLLTIHLLRSPPERHEHAAPDGDLFHAASHVPGLETVGASESPRGHPRTTSTLIRERPPATPRCKGAHDGDATSPAATTTGRAPDAATRPAYPHHEAPRVEGKVPAGQQGSLDPHLALPMGERASQR